MEKSVDAGLRPAGKEKRKVWRWYLAAYLVPYRYLDAPIGLVTMVPFALVDLWIIWHWIKHDTSSRKSVSGTA